MEPWVNLFIRPGKADGCAKDNARSVGRERYARDRITITRTTKTYKVILYNFEEYSFLIKGTHTRVYKYAGVALSKRSTNRIYSFFFGFEFFWAQENLFWIRIFLDPIFARIYSHISLLVNLDKK